MRSKPILLAVVLLCVSAASCARLPWRRSARTLSRPARPAWPAAQAGVLSAVPPAVAGAEPATATAHRPEAGEAEADTANAPPPPRNPRASGGDLLLGSAASSLTDALDRALEMLTKERTRTEILRRESDLISDELTGLQETITQRRAALKAKDAEVAELEKAVARWQKDVTIYREELRRAEEIEIETLIEVLSLLKGFPIKEPADPVAPAKGAAEPPKAPVEPAAPAQ